MSMSKQGAERAVVISALTVFGIYVYRVATEGTGSAKGGKGGGFAQLVGVGSPANIGRFVTGWGFAFLVIAMITEAAPSLGGSFAILVGVTDFLANTGQIAKDVNTALGGGTSSGSSSPDVGSALNQGGRAVSSGTPTAGAGLAGVGRAATPHVGGGLSAIGGSA